MFSASPFLNFVPTNFTLNWKQCLTCNTLYLIWKGKSWKVNLEGEMYLSRLDYDWKVLQCRVHVNASYALSYVKHAWYVICLLPTSLNTWTVLSHIGLEASRALTNKGNQPGHAYRDIYCSWIGVASNCLSTVSCNTELHGCFANIVQLK